MARLEDLKRGVQVKGILPDISVTIVDAQWYGDTAVRLTYRDSTGHLGEEVLYRDREPTLEIDDAGSSWRFDGDGALLRLASEAYRIRLAYLFDPMLGVHLSQIEPLPHQITAVYQEMLPRQPLRFLLADDPGAGKTIMTGLLIKELLIRGDVRRCLIVCPGSLVEQWQDELGQRFQLPFEIITNDRIEAAQTGNVFTEVPLAICRLDKLSRDERAQALLEQSDWDLIVCDEAHKLSATYIGGEVKYTKRYHLGQTLSQLTRHFLLLTATPHNGKNEDFHLFLALLDADRFEGHHHDDADAPDVSDLMRRLVKEKLLKFDGAPLFPERIAYPVLYQLSPEEAALYAQVTTYVQEEFNRADQLESAGRKGSVGFALTVLQRRLASSPEAIYQSLRRRRERLEKRLREEQLRRTTPGGALEVDLRLPDLTADDLDDLDDAPDAEVEALEEALVDQASAARTITELEAEIATLTRLETAARHLRASAHDRKWDELARLLRDTPEISPSEGPRRKLVIFTEHRDTLNYLADRLRTLFGREEAVVTIHGGMGRDERRKAQEQFLNVGETLVLVATDAAGEGINLQRAHLMVNYDLPWNPNRIEQRFGRIHRIGQTEVCHLWNLIAADTREGEVFHRLFEKLEEERKALGGQVFDVLGRALYDGRPLRDLVMQAIRYGDQPDVRARLYRTLDTALDRDNLRALLTERALAQETLDLAQTQQIRAEMERAAARRLQPHFIADFFLAAFRLLGGAVRERERGRFEITHTPAAVRAAGQRFGRDGVIASRYERIVFEKSLIAPQGQSPAAFICPGHPLLDAVIELTLARNGDLLRRGALLVDPTDPGVEVRALVYLEQAIQDARMDREERRHIVSRQLQFVELPGEAPAASSPSADASAARVAGYAPYLDYRPLTDEEHALLAPIWERLTAQTRIEERAVAYAITTLAPRHLAEVRARREPLIQKTLAAVQDRLSREINYWDRRAYEIRQQEQAGKTPRLNSAKAQQRAEDLAARLSRRKEELAQESHLAATAPVVVGAALIIPAGLLARLQASAGGIWAEHTRGDVFDVSAEEVAARKRIERVAMEATLAHERALGFAPRDVSAENRGYDIESVNPATGRLRFIEVKGRMAGAETVTLTKNELLTALNTPDEFVLSVVEVKGETASPPRYVRRPVTREPDFGVTSVTYNIAELVGRPSLPTLSPTGGEAVG